MRHPKYLLQALPDRQRAQLNSVAVTRWTAQLADPAAETAFRVHRFEEDRRRMLMLLVLVAAISILILVGRVFFHLGGDAHGLIYPPLVSGCMAFCAMLLIGSCRTSWRLEFAVICAGAVGGLVRLYMLSLQPNETAMWLPLMVTTLFIIYLYLPVRLLASVGLAVVYSMVAPLWWMLAPAAAMSAADIYRGILWLLLTNALGFMAANAFQRGQRTQYAQAALLQDLLSTDVLTGIANRRRFDETMQQEWLRCRRAGMPLSLLIMDVDHFKSYNDRNGHQQGDECLRRVAAVLAAEPARPGDLVARYGGEEFVCLLPGVDERGARAVAARLSASLHRAAIPHPTSPLGPNLTISIGVATATDLGGEPANLFALADKMLYAAKHAGRNRAAFGRLPAEPVPLREVA